MYSTIIHTNPHPLLQFDPVFVFVLQEFEQAIIAPPYFLYVGTKYNN